mgnify:CR=1 FL=1
MPAYLQFPSWIRPTIIPGLPFHWYGLMYLVAFGVTYLLVRYQVKTQNLDYSGEDIADLFFYAIIGLLVGARVFAALVYDPTGYYLEKPWMIFWPFDENMNFTGFQGMSYHGGLVGVIIAGIVYTRVKKFDFFDVADLMVAGIPLGYTFGRLGNFINGELWGRVTTSPVGMIFPHAPRYSTSKDWVRRIADEVGIPYDAGDYVQLPRHPSQLYEAFFEGIVLWIVLWFVFRPRRKFSGQLLGVYIIGYGLVRFFIEYLRQPDVGIGYPVSFAARTEPQALLLSPWNFTTGQILCAAMIVLGAGLLLLRRRKAVKKTGV